MELQTNAAECRGVRAVALWRVDCLVGADSAFRILRHNCVTTGCSRPRRSGSHLGVRAACGCADSSPPYLWHAHAGKQLLVTSDIVEAGLLVRGEGWLVGIRFVVS